MTIIEHVYELRRRLFLALSAVVLGGVLGFLWFEYPVGPVPSLGNLLTEPYCSLSPRLRLNIGEVHGCRLLQTQPFEAFLIRIKAGFAAGAVLTSPIWFHQIWGFVAPALRKSEKRFTGSFVSCSALLFCVGAVLAYKVVPVALNALLSIGGDQFVSALSGGSYISFVLALLIIFGLSFELPLVIIMLNRIGVLSYDRLRRWRRGFILGIFAFAAVATPGSDIFSMMALALALTVLFEIAVQVTRVNDRRRARRLEADDAAAQDDHPLLREPI